MSYADGGTASAAGSLEPQKKQFWEPDTSNYYHARISMNGPLGSTEHDLFISHELSEESILDNLQDALW